MKRRAASADELDVVSAWRHRLSWGRGEVARIKRGMRRRERAVARLEVLREAAAERVALMPWHPDD